MLVCCAAPRDPAPLSDEFPPTGTRRFVIRTRDEYKIGVFIVLRCRCEMLRSWGSPGRGWFGLRWRRNIKEKPVLVLNKELEDLLTEVMLAR